MILLSFSFLIVLMLVLYCFMLVCYYYNVGLIMLSCLFDVVLSCWFGLLACWLVLLSCWFGIVFMLVLYCCHVNLILLSCLFDFVVRLVWYCCHVGLILVLLFLLVWYRHVEFVCIAILILIWLVLFCIMSFAHFSHSLFSFNLWATLLNSEWKCLDENANCKHTAKLPL